MDRGGMSSNGRIRHLHLTQTEKIDLDMCSYKYAREQNIRELVLNFAQTV